MVGQCQNLRVRGRRRGGKRKLLTLEVPNDGDCGDHQEVEPFEEETVP